jgi:hypothetical protein
VGYLNTTDKYQRYITVDINRAYTPGIGFFSITLQCTGGTASVPLKARMYCIFFKKPVTEFPPIFTLIIICFILAMVFAAILWCIGAFFEKGMEAEFRATLEKDAQRLKGDDEAIDEHKK